MRNYLKLLSFLKGHLHNFVLAVGLMLISTAFEGVQVSMIVPMIDVIFNRRQIVFPVKLPGIVQQFIDTLNRMDPQKMLSHGIILIMCLMITKHIINFFYGYLMNDISQKIMQDIRLKLYTKIQNLSLDYFSKKRSGELISRITNDVQLVENALSYGVTDLFRQTFTIAMFITGAFAISLKLTGVIFFFLPLMAWPIIRIGKKLRKIAVHSQDKMADINSFLLETISGVRVVKAFRMEPYEIDRFRKQNFEYYKLRMKSIKRILLISPITDIVGVFCGIFVIWWFGQQVIAGQLSFGVFALFMWCIFGVISPVKKLGNVNALTQQALAANTRIYEVLETKSTIVEKNNAFALPAIRKGIKFDNVSFRYQEDLEFVLENINLEIRTGQLVAIVGPTGTGKTTLANLISRFYDPSTGAVTMDGVNLKDVSLKSLRDQIGIVDQETILFNDTVRNNIAYGKLDAIQQEIEEAAKKSFAHPFIMQMPEGYQTNVGDRGFRLSGGEKQRIAIARAILRNPPILILDEATSQLDSESEKIIQAALDELMKDRTTIAIAHRLSTIMRADQIVVLHQRDLVGLGTHDNLLKTCGLYKRLYDSQFAI